MASSSFDVILLAAGLSARMGHVNKLLIEVDGMPLIRRSAALYCDLGMRVTAVLGHQADLVCADLEGLPLQTVLNADYATGQQSSIRTGLSAASLQGEGLLMALGDQPLLEKEDISELCETFLKSGDKKILIPHFEGKRGNPVVLPAKLARQMRANDILPRKFMDTHPELTSCYNAATPNFTTDLDTQDDMDRLLSAND